MSHIQPREQCAVPGSLCTVIVWIIGISHVQRSIIRSSEVMHELAPHTRCGGVRIVLVLIASSRRGGGVGGLTTRGFIAFTGKFA